MTVFESINFKNIDDFTEWLDKYKEQSFEPWECWFDENYCNKCKTVVKKDANGVEHEYAWCEFNHNKCKFFQDMEEIPYGKQVIKMWLESEA